MDPRLVRNRLVFILEHIRQCQTATDPFSRAEHGVSAINRIMVLMAELDAELEALPAAQAAADTARTACREHLYRHPTPPCVHEDDGQEEAGMGEPASVPAPWKSPD